MCERPEPASGDTAQPEEDPVRPSPGQLSHGDFRAEVLQLVQAGDEDAQVDSFAPAAVATPTLFWNSALEVDVGEHVSFCRSSQGYPCAPEGFRSPVVLMEVQGDARAQGCRQVKRAWIHEPLKTPGLRVF